MLPTIPVPLRPPDADVPLNLAALVTQAYDRGRYDSLIRYDQPPPQELLAADRDWAAALTRAAAVPVEGR